MFSFRSVRIVAVCVFLFALTIPASLEAQQGADEGNSAGMQNLSLALDVTYNGKYVWRGINTVDGDVLQPSGTLRYGGLSFNVWANMDLDNVNGQSGDFTEIDLTLDYTWSMDFVDLSVGRIYYTFPHSGQAPSTIEIYAGGAPLMHRWIRFRRSDRRPAHPFVPGELARQYFNRTGY